MSTDIVVGIDGSDNACAALAWAVDEAVLRGVRVRAVLSWTYIGQKGSGFGVLTTEEDAQRVLGEAVAKASGDRAGLVDQVVVNDLPVRGLLEQAANAALLVVGSRGIGGVKGLVLGSVSRSMVERASVPVVVVPNPGDD